MGVSAAVPPTPPDHLVIRVVHVLPVHTELGGADLQEDTGHGASDELGAEVRQVGEACRALRPGGATSAVNCMSLGDQMASPIVNQTTKSTIDM